MFGLTTIKGLIKRVGLKQRLAAVAIAALVFLSSLPATAQAQGTSNTDTGLTVVHAGTVGMVRGQTLIIALPNYMCFQDGSVRPVKHSIGVTARESNLTYSGESGGLNELGHIFSIRYDDLPAAGEPRTDRAQVWIEVESFSLPTQQGQAEDPEAVVLPTTLTFEVVDEIGRTTVHGTLTKVGAGRLTLSGTNSL